MICAVNPSPAPGSCGEIPFALAKREGSRILVSEGALDNAQYLIERCVGSQQPSLIVTRVEHSETMIIGAELRMGPSESGE